MNRFLLRKTMRDLRAGWTQSLALIVIVALGVSSFIALVGAYRDLDTSYQHTYDQLRFGDVSFELAAAPAAIVADIAKINGVTAVTGRLIVDTGYELPSGEPIRARLIGVPAGAQPAVNQLFISEGAYLPLGSTDSAVVEANFARIYELNVGDMVQPLVNGEPHPLTINGIGTAPEYLIVSPSQQDILPSARTFAILFVPLTSLQSWTDRPETINNISLIAAPDADLDGIIVAATALLAKYQLEGTVPAASVPSNAALTQDLAAYRELSNLMPALILLVAAGSVYIMLSRLVRSQQAQIGVMKALGYSRRTIWLHYLIFAWSIGGIGLLMGLALGIPLAAGITTTYASELGIPLVATRIYADLIGQSVLLCAALITLAGLGPARSATQLTPALAIRLDPSLSTSKGGIGYLERLVPLPLWLRLPWRNVWRQKRRSLSTGVGIIFAFILVLMVWGFFDTMAAYTRRNFREVERWDLIAVFDQPLSAADIAHIAAMPGVSTVEPLLQLPVKLTVAEQGEEVLLTAFAPNQKLHVLQLPAGDQPAAVLGDRQIILSNTTADLLGVGPGAAILVDTPLGQETFTLSSTTDEMMSAVAYIDIADAQALLPLPQPLFSGFYLTGDAARLPELKIDLYHLPGAASIQLKSDIERDWRSFLDLFYALMGIMLVFALGMAFALLFNTVTTTVLERQREFATMRAVGASRRSLAGQMTLENVILWLVTLVPGLWLGQFVAGELGKAMSAELFTFDVTIQPFSYVLTAVGILVTMMLATWPALRRIGRLNLAEATKVLT